MLSNRTKIIVAIIGTSLMMTFIVGIAYSISTGFAGFWGGLPFWIISLSVMSMALYDFWDECLRKKNQASK
ncbi:MAG: hypothetical protein JKY83_11815 [Rhizobiaceae bacterium]|nr:hypothetical protein [Rhizobiaceae bacterium]